MLPKNKYFLSKKTIPKCAYIILAHSRKDYKFNLKHLSLIDIDRAKQHESMKDMALIITLQTTTNIVQFGYFGKVKSNSFSLNFSRGRVSP